MPAKLILKRFLSFIVSAQADELVTFMNTDVIDVLH